MPAPAPPASTGTGRTRAEGNIQSVKGRERETERVGSGRARHCDGGHSVTVTGDIGAHFAAWYLHYLHYLPWIHVMLEWAGPVQPRQ